MAYSIRLPDGTLVRNIPDELSPEQAKEKIIKAYPQYAPESGVLRQAADIPVQVGRGAVMGVRMLSDALGADNPVSQALRGAEDYLGDLLSAQAKQDQKEIARILKDAEDKGVLDQVKAGIQALTVAPVDLVSQVLGTAVPTIAAGMAGAAAKLGAVGIGTLQAGTGATMGAGLAKGNIYEVVKEELTAAGLPENVAEERAKAAQNYTGENWDQIILGGALGGAAALGPLERIFARLPAISPQVAAKNIFARSAAAGVAEAAPEAAQAFQEQVAQNIALQREGFDVPTFRGAVANATLEGLAGFGIGAPIGALEGKPGATKPPGQQDPTEPTAPPPAAPIVPEGELTPEEEAELQARISAAPPPAAGLPVAPTPTPPISPAPATATPEAVALPEPQQVTPQIPVEAAPELEALTTQLGKIQQARMDPTLSPDDPAFLEFDQQEAAIQSRIQELTAPPVAVTQPPVQPLAPEITSPAAPVITPIIAQTPSSPPQDPKGAADNFLDAVVTQFGMDRGEAQKALDTLVQEELIELDPNSRQFRMKDGRFWDPDVMRKAAAMQTAAPPLQLPQPLAPPVAPVVEPEVIPEEALVEAPVVTPPQIQGPRFGLSSVLDSPAQPLAPEITPSVIEAAPSVAPVARSKDEVQAEINRVRQSMKRAQTAVNKGRLPEAEVIKLQERMTALETELDAAKAGKRKPKYRSAEGNTWIGTGAIPGWLNKKLEAGFQLSDFEIRPELGDKSEVEVELEKPPGFGRPAPATRPPQEYERLSRQIDEAEAETPNLFTVLKGRLTDTDVIDISPEKSFSFLRAGKGKGTELSELVDSDELTAYLPDELQPGTPNFDAGEAAEYIKDLLRQDPATDPEARLSYYTRTVLLKDLRQQLDEIEQELEPEDVNQLIQEIIAEERAAIADIEAGAIEEQERGPAVPSVPTDFALTGQTPEELAELQRREESGEAEAERDRLEAEEAAKAASEAERKIADQKRDTFQLAPPPSAPAVQAAGPVGDLFGTTGIREQPTRAPRAVAAEPSPIEQMAEDARAAEEMGSPQQVLDDLIKELGRGVGKRRIETPDETTILTEETWDGDTTIKRLEFDAIVSLASKTDTPRGAKYSILIKDTPTESITFSFQPMGLKPLDRTVGMKYVLSKTTLDTDVPPLEDNITERMRQLGVADFEDASKKVQEAYGVSKPVADAYVRAVRKQAEAVAKSSYGKATENEFQDAYDEAEKLRKRMEGISKRKEAKAEKKEEGFTISRDGIEGYEVDPSRVPNGNDAFQYVVGRVETGRKEEVYRRRADERGTYGGWRVETSVDKLIPEKPSIRKTREVAEGTVVERIELPDNIEIRIVKIKNGYSVYQYDLDADQIVMGQQRQFRSPAFPKDQDAYQAAEAFASDMFDKVVPKMTGEMQAAMKERLSRGEDVINNKTPNPDIPADQRLVLMACCATKKKGMGMGPAIEVYTGVFFQTLKNKLKEGAMPNLRILSAKYGFIAPDQKIEIYDQVMDKAAADKFMLDDKLVEGFPSNIKDVLIVGSDQYQRVMKAAIEDLIKAGKIDKGASINVTKGGIGEQRSQLGKYLASLPVKKETEAKKTAKTPLAFYQQMIPDAGFKRLDLDDPRTYKNKSGEEFLTFERDGVRVAVKSNTQLYAADRGVGMYMGKDNDLLIQAMIVDESARRQGKATKALQDIFSMADQAGMTSYIEPVQMTKDVGMTTEQLKDFYKQFGFKPQKTEPVTDRVMVREPGAKIEVKKEEKLKDDEADMEFMLKGTEDEQKGIRAVAETVGGTPVYFDPNTKIGLVRGYGQLTGKPVYAMTMGDRYSTADVEESTVAVFAPYKAQLIEVKKRLEKEAEQKHKDDPFVKFENGIAMSKSIDASIGGIITEWKSMLGLGGVNVYFSTIEDAKKNRDNFTGPHRAIGSGTLDAGEGGSMRRMQDGSYYVLFKKGTSKTAMLEILAHELGHVHEREAYQNAPQELKDKLKEAHARWVAQRKGKTAREAVDMLRAKTTAQTTSIAPGKERAEDLRPYWSSFSEWYADQVSRWAVTDEKPVGVVEKFFARLGAALRRFYQTLKGQKYLPDETFVQYLKQVKPVIVEEIPGPVKDPVQIEMSFQMQKDLFGSAQEAKEIEQVMEVKGKKKLPPGRSPELTAAAQAVQAGTMTAEEFNKLVDIYRPIPLYEEPLKPATSEQVFDALDVKKREQINPQISNGTKVGLRLDIPAFNRKGVFVVSIHQKRTASAPGKVIGYGSVAKAKNVTFGVGNQLKALEIAAGSAKDALQTMEGEYVNVTPEQAFAEAQRAIKDPSYVQIGIDPTRHAYFYDRRTTLPVVSAEEVIQIGNMILAKKPVFGSKQNFLYNIEGGPIAGDTQPADMSFLDRLRIEDDNKRKEERNETMAYYKSIRRKEAAMLKKVREYGSTLELQRQLNNLNEIARELKEDLDLDKQTVYSAENFLRQARAALEGVAPYKEQAISPDVFAVIQSVYMDDPKLLEGLRLSIKPEFSKQDQELRRAFGMKRQTAGTFMPMQRLINLYTGTRGVTNPSTIRHELTHTLEQMMTEKQRQALLNSYLDAIKKAMRKHKDAKSQEFFDLVLEFLNNPTDKAVAKMNDAMPSMDFYQYTSPSEYWAVNAEKLMAQRLGTSWDRFKKAIRKVFEKMKKIFGFDNRFAVHDVFDKIMSGSKERMDRRALVDYIGTSGDSFAFLANIEEDAELVRRYNRADTPMLDHSPMRRMIVNAGSFTKDMFNDMVQNPSDALRMMFNSLNRGIMYLRNKNIWFGSGINEADRIRYNGAVKTAEGLATASLALDNMIRGGNIATQTVFQGGIEFNKDTQMYSAVQKDKSMTKVYEAEAKLKEKLGEQLGTNIIQGYLEAKRSRSIKEEVETRKELVDGLSELIDEQVAELKALDANPKATKEQKDAVNRELRKSFKEFRQLKDELDTIRKIAEEKVTMSEAEIEDFISREEAHPELKEIINNFGAVNQNLLRFWKDVGLLSDPRYARLSAIKDYVPWYRIMNDEEDVHSPLQATTRSATNIGKEKLFKSGKPSVINDFIIEEGQDVFKIQPSRINAVKLNGVRLKPDQYESTPNGEVRLKVEYKPNDVLVIETQREIENMIDNMTRNVMRMTMNGLRQYAANRIVSEYATRDSKGQIMTFPKVDREKGRFDYIYNGRRTIVEIQDPLIAEAVLGMETVGMEMWKPLAAAANFTRRTITLSPVFQLKQVFKDAPTAALVTGVKRPDLLMGGVMRDFIGAVRDNDPVAEILRSQGIGGFYSPARTPEADVKRRIGIINNNTFDYTMKALDHFGDSSDMAQRIAIYKRVMAETGNESLALYQAANVINFLRHGSGQVAQALVKTVPFLNAYAQSIDVLYDALRGGGLRGKDRSAALIQLGYTGSLLAGSTLLYAFLVGDDDDYMKMDDQSKIRSYMIPGTDVVLPMNTSAAFFFKAIPELLYNKVVNEGTENEVDAKRLRTAMKEAAVDLLLGPTPVPSAVKPVIEISLDYNFFTSRPITPRGMDNLDAYQQYDMRTSEAAKLLSALTGSKENRVLNPMEADHLVRSIFGTAGAMVAWSSNLVGQAAEFRPEMGLKEMPITGAFLRPEVPRGREDLFYKLKENTDRKYRTFNRLIERDQIGEAEAYIGRHPNLIAYYDYTSEVDTQLKEINAAIRFIGETQDPSYTPEIKRQEIQDLLNLKQDVLEGVEQFRKEAYAD